MHYRIAEFAEKYEIGNLVDSDRIKNERGERYHLLGNIPHLSKFIWQIPDKGIISYILLGKN